MIEDYYKRLKEFKDTHLHIECENCKCHIQPGDKVILYNNIKFCSYECLGVYLSSGEYRFLDGDIDDEVYENMFPLNDN